MEKCEKKYGHKNLMGNICKCQEHESSYFSKIQE